MVIEFNSEKKKQVRRLAMEVRQLASSRQNQITVLNGGSSGMLYTVSKALKKSLFG